MNASTSGTGVFGLLQPTWSYSVEGPELLECEAAMSWDVAEQCLKDRLWVLDLSLIHI